MTAVGQRIRALREQAGLSVQELADDADVGAARLADVETGSAHPTNYECRALEDVLGCKPGELQALAHPPS